MSSTQRVSGNLLKGISENNLETTLASIKKMINNID